MIPPIDHPRFPENPPGPRDFSLSRLATVIREEGWLAGVQGGKVVKSSAVV